MTGTRLSTPLLSSILLLGSDRVLSFSGINYPGCRCHHPSLQFPKNPLVELRANNDDDNKLDWDPKSNPKIAQLPSYSDNWLLNFHNWDQSEKQLVTNSLAAWNEEIRNEQATIIEWQDSFQRNDLADFTPPMSNGLNCLMIGDDFDMFNDGSLRVKLPWEEEPEAQITSLRVLEESVVDIPKEDSITEITEQRQRTVGIEETNEDIKDNDDEIIITVNDDDDTKDAYQSENGVSTAVAVLAEGSTGGKNGGMVRTELVRSAPTVTKSSASSSAIRVQDSNKQAAVYDCIVDQGLMDRILALENSDETVRELMEEAAVAIKDLGIYVLVTKVLTEDSRRVLEEYGLKAGLEWQFELDGISDDTQVVSVARRFCTGEMPKVGRLSRYQPQVP